MLILLITAAIHCHKQMWMSTNEDFPADVSSEWEESSTPPTGPMVELHQKPLSEVLDTSFIKSILQTSPTRSNFATDLMRCFFTRETRISSNVAGKCGKRRLDPDVITAIKIATFNAYPCAAHEDKDACWKACIRAIDEANRRLYRKKPAVATKD